MTNTAANTKPEIITNDGRPEYQYGALMAHLGHRAAGWVPAFCVTADDVETLIAQADEHDPAMWVGWNEHGAIVTEPRS